MLDSRGRSQLTLALEAFAIERDPAGRPEQFRSQLRLIPPAEEETHAEISVNHPLRYRGITLYQADWSLAAITLQLGRSPLLQLPLQSFPQLGEQIWGLVLPTAGWERSGAAEPEQRGGSRAGVRADGQALAQLVPGGEAQEVKGLPIGGFGAAGQRDPAEARSGVPLVYTGFAIALAGGGPA